MKRLLTALAALGIVASFAGSATQAPATAEAGGSKSSSVYSRIECVTKPSGAQNVSLTCPKDYQPTREPTLAVDPTDPRHMVVVAIKGTTPLREGSGSKNGEQSIQFSTTFDGGRTWTIGVIPHRQNEGNWDPWVSFDVKHGAVIVAYETDADKPQFCPQNQLSVTSMDGGLHWDPPLMVLGYRRCKPSARIYEQGAIATDNNPSSPYFGRTWLTGTLNCPSGICTRPIAESHSDDGGRTWTRPHVISGSNPRYCPWHPFNTLPRCNFNEPPAVPAVGPDGTVYVSFGNLQHKAASEPPEANLQNASGFPPDGQLMVVSSKDGGRTWSPPVHVVDLEDGSRDGIGDGGDDGSNLVVGPHNRLYIAFSDNRDGRHDVPHPVSNSDVFIVASTDGGKTWGRPAVVSDAPGDQFRRPMLAMNPVTEELGVLFYDRSADPDGKTMNVTLATGLPGSFHLTRVTTAPSHLSNDLWFAATTPTCHKCEYHLGEYIGLAYGSDGFANMVWPDLRRFVELPNGRKGYAMNVMYARSDMSRP